MTRPRLSLQLAVLLACAAPARGQVFLQRLVGPEAQPVDFGSSVALTGTIAVVGEPNGGPTGRVHAFDVVTGKRLWKLGKPLEFAPYFGQRVAADGDRVLAATFGGATLVIDAPTGQVLGSLAPLDFGTPEWAKGFGLAVDISGDLAVVTAESGRAYVFDVVTGEQVGRFASPKWPADSDFGVSVAIDGPYVAVGDPAVHFGGDDAVYVFDLTTGALVSTLLGDGGDLDGFGSSVDLRGATVLVGAPYARTGAKLTGAAFVFDVDGQRRARLTPPSGELGTNFGAGVRLGEGRAVVSAPKEADGDGAVHVFDLATGRPLWSVGPRDRRVFEERFGDTIDVDCGRLLSGAPRDVWTGAVYLHTFGTPSAGRSYCGPANPNSTGQAGELTVVGRTEVACDLVLPIARSLPAGMPGVLLTSRTQGFVPFVGGSQGDLCLGGALGRFPEVGVVDAAGVLRFEVDLREIPLPAGVHAVQPGETWNFQAWYRDVNPTPTSNLTDAVAITFR